jgi:hypothetical protein
MLGRPAPPGRSFSSLCAGSRLPCSDSPPIPGAATALCHPRLELGCWVPRTEKRVAECQERGEEKEAVSTEV